MMATTETTPEGSGGIDTRPGARLSVQVIVESEALERLRPCWLSWQRNPNADFEHFQLICGLRSNVISPYVVVIRDESGPRALMACRLENGHFAPTLGYVRPLKVPVRRLEVIHGGLMGDESPAVLDACVMALHQALAEGRADLVQIGSVRVDSPFHQALETRRDGFWQDSDQTSRPHWALRLPAEPGGIVAALKGKHRTWIRRKWRDLDENHPGSWSIRALQPDDSVAEVCAEIEQVARFTYQRSLGAGFRDNPEQRARWELFQRRGMLRAWILVMDGAPAAYAAGILVGDTFHFGVTGYRPEHRDEEIGTLIFLHMTDALIREKVTHLDFGLGDAAYKRRFGDTSWQETGVRLYRRGAKGAALRSLEGVFGACSTAGLKLLARYGLTDRVRTLWRRSAT